MRRLLLSSSFLSKPHHSRLFHSNNHKNFKFLQNAKCVHNSNNNISNIVPQVGSSRRMYVDLNSTLAPTTKNKIVVIMGATGSGKSKLSLDLATNYFPSEIINSDKIQVLKGLDITTNKISIQEQNNIVHHLLGEYEFSFSDFTPSDFRFEANKRISDIINRNKIPLIVGGSNSFIYSLLSNRFNPSLDVFDEVNPVQCISKELRFNCCFIWVDVKTPVLNQYLDKRVDEMMKTGMYEELEEFFKENGFGSGSGRVAGLWKAIGVPEMEGYFRKKKSYEEALNEIKENTRLLAEKQMWKIGRLREAGWDLQRIDATEAFKAAMMTSVSPEESNKVQARVIWERDVLIPSMKIVKHFLLE